MRWPNLSLSVPDAPPAPIHALRSLAVFAEAPSDEHTRIAAALGFDVVPSPAQYSDIFLFQLYPYGSVYLGPEGMMGGVARERIAGFWHAVGLTPPPEPDHLTGLLGLYASLVERAERPDEAAGSLGGVEAVGGSEDAESVLADQAARALLDEHLAPWVFHWLDRVKELTSGTYATWASLLRDVLDDAYRGAATHSSDLQHLRDAPPLSDPREDGTAEFIKGLLAPVRSGFILTRADLGEIARALDLGLRAGERRYALEHLLAQDPERTLAALAAEARRQADLHEARASWLGESALFFTARARTTAALCDELREMEPS